MFFHTLGEDLRKEVARLASGYQNILSNISTKVTTIGATAGTGGVNSNNKNIQQRPQSSSHLGRNHNNNNMNNNFMPAEGDETADVTVVSKSRRPQSAIAVAKTSLTSYLNNGNNTNNITNHNNNNYNSPPKLQNFTTTDPYYSPTGAAGANDFGTAGDLSPMFDDPLDNFGNSGNKVNRINSGNGNGNEQNKLNVIPAFNPNNINNNNNNSNNSIHSNNSNSNSINRPTSAQLKQSEQQQQQHAVANIVTKYKVGEKVMGQYRGTALYSVFCGASV